MDVYPNFHRPDVIDCEGFHTITTYWANEGPAFFEGVDLIWEINGVIDSIYAWTKGRTVYGGLNLSNDGLFFSTHHKIYFEPDTEYQIKVTAVNPNGFPDIKPENNVYEFTIPAFEAEYDLALAKSSQPFNTEKGKVQVDVNSLGNA